MKSWKMTVRIGDLADDQRLEVICRTCNAVRYLKKCVVPDTQQFIDELEATMLCVKRGCRGRVRISMVRRDEMSGFIGGLA